jgi:peptide chain release factor subunit 1
MAEFGLKGQAIKMTAKEKHHLKQFVKSIENHKGRGTELVSVYVPAGYDINKVNSQLAQEQGTATNIKSKQTRDNVIAALERMIQHLKLFSKTPPNGLAAFAGNTAEREGQQDYQVWSIEPPLPLNTRIYRCDKEFILEPLREMVEDKEVYGLVVMDMRDATIALLKGKIIIPLTQTHSEVAGKTRSGGQSAPRFARLREGAQKDHYKKVADYMKEQFLFLEGLKGIIIGGPSTTTNDFMTRDYLTGDVKKKIIAVKDLSYTNEFGLQELLEKSADVLAEEEVSKEKAMMQKFFERLAKNSDATSYGLEATRNALDVGAVDILLLSEELDEDVIAELEGKADKMGSTVEIISVDTREGVQLRDMGKVAAILRFALQS